MLHSRTIRPGPVRRRGNVSAVVAVTLPVILGVAALSLDGGLLYSSHQLSQSVTDGAALAAGYSLYTNYATDKGLDPTNKAKNAAIQIASDNNFTNDGSTSTVTVNVPPSSQSANFSGKSGYVEVVITYSQPRCFSALWGSGSMSVTTRSVARGTKVPGYGIIALDPSNSGSLQVGNSAGGGSQLTINNSGGIQVDSSNGTALTLSNNGTINAGTVNIVGGYSAIGSSTINATKNTGASYVSDPLKSLPTPDPSALQARSPNTNVYYPYSIDPGVYNNDLSLSGGGSSVTMNSGIYYIKKSFSVSNGVSVKSASGGVLIYLDSGATINLINGGGATTLGPMASGSYAGVTIFQARSNTNTVFFGNGSAMKIDGTIYAPAGMVQFTQGNSTGSFSWGSSTNLYPSIVANQVQVINGAKIAITGTGAGKSTVAIVE